MSKLFLREVVHCGGGICLHFFGFDVVAPHQSTRLRYFATLNAHCNYFVIVQNVPLFDVIIQSVPVGFHPTNEVTE